MCFAHRWKTPRVRIGTWNLDAHWSVKHAAALAAVDCDIWLLTEVRADSELAGFAMHFSAAKMARGQHYSAVMSRLALTAVPGPHPASVAAEISGLTVCASVLPWALNDNPQIGGSVIKARALNLPSRRSSPR